MYEPSQDQPPPSYDKHKGYSPFVEDIDPPQDSYLPTQSAYPPEQGAYPPTQSAYPPVQSAYPPVQGTYLPVQSAYPPAQSAYPPQNQPQYSTRGQEYLVEGAYHPAHKGPVDVDIGYSTNDTEILIPVENHGLSDPDIRRGFIRKVYLILCVQFGITVATIYLMQHFVGNLSETWDVDIANKVFIAMWSCFAIFLAVEIMLVCFVSLRRKHPINIILLFLFTLAMSGFVGCVTLYYSIQAVTIAMGSTCIITLGLTLFACQTKIDFTSKGAYIFAAFMVFFCFGFFMIFFYSRVLQVVYGCIGVFIFSMFLVYDTQLLIGGRKYELTEEEYVFGALILYIDVIQLFLRLLSCTGRR